MLLKTDFLYTAIGKPIKNGMLRLDNEGGIMEVGVGLQAEPSEVNYFPGGLCPGFVNTHCHLELSHLKGKIKSGKGLIAFIEGVQNERKAEEEEIQEAIKEADEEMWKNGIVAVGDISNGNSSFHQKQKSPIQYHTFLELFGFDPVQAENVWKRGKDLKAEAEKLGLSATLVPHSPYSVSKQLFHSLQSEKQNGPLSIHNQESAAENELYQNASGAFKQMLEGFGLSTEHIQASRKNSLPSYLPFLPNESPLLLVHNTYTAAEDIKAAEKIHPNLFWCFCPQANHYIEMRLPNIPEFINQRVKSTLGTDSLASNYGLSILDEMKLIQAEFPEVSSQTLIAWACKNGADFLGLYELGSFEVGKKPGVNWLKGMAKDGVLGSVKVEKIEGEKMIKP
jgi:cytosine/adenosine deaminase-related metal-dependent hydrolase